MPTISPKGRMRTTTEIYLAHVYLGKIIDIPCGEGDWRWRVTDWERGSLTLSDGPNITFLEQVSKDTWAWDGVVINKQALEIRV